MSVLVTASRRAATTAARTEKVEALAAALTQVDAEEVSTAVALLTGIPRQGRVGIGWATVGDAHDGPDRPATGDAADREGLTIGDVDRAVDDVGRATGPGSERQRRTIVGALFDRAADDEAEFLTAVFLGGLRQGALGGVMASAIAKAFGVKLGSVRRAAMLLGDLGQAAHLAATDGEAGLSGVRLTVGRAVEPMLAATASTIREALGHTGPASVEWKLDGIRIQVHRAGDTVQVFTRNLNDITDRTGGVVAAVASLAAGRLILDGEILGSRPYFFDALHVDGEDLLDRPLEERLDVLAVVAPDLRVPSIRTDDVAEAERHLRSSLDAGHEGALVKALDTTYQAGRRGKGWRKVKPVHTLDLVVLGAEWGHGRRRGWLSNLHLGALDPATGRHVMVGKTFKGLTDDLLRWQTEQILAREERREGITVFARPELVVEIALDASHASTRYPGGVALRFARVRRYRDDKAPQETNTLDDVRALMVSLPVHESLE